MTYGINGNTQKNELWRPVARLVRWLQEQTLPFCLHELVAQGLYERGLIDAGVCSQRSTSDLAGPSDVILSFGGDGTLLRSAHEIDTHRTPILGVNIGRLGFLADIDEEQVEEAIRQLEDGAYRIEPRSVLRAHVEDGTALNTSWALNEFVIERGGPVGLISIDVQVDGVPLNNYWADGLIIATPTGSTAYSLAVGGPIVAPGSDVMLLSPLAPHSLTVRPVVLPLSSVIEARVSTGQQPYVLAADGNSTLIKEEGLLIRIHRAEHEVYLVKLLDQHYFQTLHSKLMWGAHNRK